MTENNKNNVTVERRLQERRQQGDRRTTVRFGDILGRRTGVDRRVVAVAR